MYRFVIFLTLCIAALLIALKVRTLIVQSAPEQKLFLHGKLPAAALGGVYKGTVNKLETNWTGKEFMPQEAAGINNFKKENEIVKKYPFKTYSGIGVLDNSLEVIKIDYDIPENPFWLRLLLDEVVETETGKLLGKVHVRLLPNLVFTLGYFNLEK